MHRDVRFGYSVMATVVFVGGMGLFIVLGGEREVPAHIAIPITAVWLALFIYLKLRVIYRDNLARAKKHIRANRLGKAIAELELGAENRHVRCVIALADMALHGRLRSRDPRRAAQLYSYAVHCMALHLSQPERFSIGRGEMPTPATRDSSEPVRNKRRLAIMAANLEHYGDRDDPETRELIEELRGRVGGARGETAFSPPSARRQNKQAKRPND